MTNNTYDCYLNHKIFLRFLDPKTNTELTHIGNCIGVNETHITIDDRFIGLTSVLIRDIIRIGESK